MYTYKIQAGNTVEVFVEGQEAPMLQQPHYPNGDAWESKAKAEDWAKLFIASMENEAAPFAPVGKGIPGEPKPSRDEILKHLKTQADRFGDNVPKELADRIALYEQELGL